MAGQHETPLPGALGGLTSLPKKRIKGTSSPHDQDSTAAARAREVLDALRRIVRELRRSSSDDSTRPGVSAAQLFVLQALAEKPGSSVNDLAARTNTDQSSVSVVVRRLALAKLVARKVAAEDGRRVELRLTAAGRRFIAQRPPPPQIKLFAALERLSVAELQALQTGLAAVVREMNIADTPPSMFFEDDDGPPKRRARRKQTGSPPRNSMTPARPSRAP